MFPPKGPTEDPSLFEPPAPGPQAPMRPEPTKINRAMALVALGLGLKNPAAGSGWAEGLLRHQQSTDRSNEVRYRSDMDAYEGQVRQAQIQQQQAAQQQKLLMDAADTLKQQMPTFKNKADYDQAITGFERLLGMRSGAGNVFRQMAPYSAPDIQVLADAAVEKIIKSPHLKDMLEADSWVDFDRDRDGVDERIRFSELMALAKRPMVYDKTSGKPIFGQKGTVVPTDRFGAKHHSLKEIFRAEKNREPTPQEADALVDQAMKATAENQRAPRDPALQSLAVETAQIRLDLLKEQRDRLKAEVGPKLSPGQASDVADMDTLAGMTRRMLDFGNKNDWSGVGGLGRGSIEAWIASNLGKGKPEGVQLRSMIQNIKGTIAKLRGGTSFTPNEQALLDSYTPSMNEEPMSIMAKAQELVAFLEAKRQATINSARPGVRPDAPSPGQKRGRFIVTEVPGGN